MEHKDKSVYRVHLSSNLKGLPDEEKLITPITLTNQSLYPTMNSLDDVVSLANEKLSTLDKNVMLSLLMTYHNTMLATAA